MLFLGQIMTTLEKGSADAMDPSSVGDERPFHRGQMRKACDFCRKSKIKCEKPDDFPSCLPCYHKGLACIITKTSDMQQSNKSRSRSSVIEPDISLSEIDNTCSNIVGYKQWSVRSLHDFIYMHNSSFELEALPPPWRSLIQSQCGDHWAMVEEWIRRAKQIDFGTPTFPIGQQQIYIHLPSEEEILHVLETFSHYTADILPLFREERLVWINTRRYADPALIHDAQCWASLNVALAIGYKISFIHHLEFVDRDWKSRAHLKNALATVPHLLLAQSPTLETIQVLLGIVFLVQSSLEVTLHQNLLSVAIRMSLDIGLHRSEVRHGDMSKEEYEQRVRVFWMGYVMDKSTCFTQGLMGCGENDDIDIELPNINSLDKTGLHRLSNGKRVSLFRLCSEMAVLRHKIYKSLYSTRSAHITDIQYKYIVKELGDQLTAWKESLPSNSDIHLETDQLILSRLLVTYHNSIISLYQWSLFYRETRYHKEANDSTQSSRAAWTSLCVSSARQTIIILRDENRQNTIAIRNVIPYAFTSYMILFMYILDNPSAITASEDLQNLQTLREYLSDLAEQNLSSISSAFHARILRLVQVCSICEGLARRSTRNEVLSSRQN